MNQILSRLWPRPKHLRLLGGNATPSQPLLFVQAEKRRLLESAWSDRERQETLVYLFEGENPPPRAMALDLRIEPANVTSPEAYELLVDEDRIRITAASESGLFYGLGTLRQLLDLHPDIPLPRLEIEDSPSLAERGVLLDVSRDKVPTLSTLFGLVDRLARFKINRLQLYFEHSFAYQDHETVWQDASPLTAEEIRSLDAYCEDRHILLVPNQNTFGHFHRWLIHDRYRPLAECPEGIEHPFSRDIEPFSLCATDPRSLELIEDLFGQLLPLFRGSIVNAGLDETFDLGQGRSKDACEEQGKSEIYLQYLRGVRKIAARHGKRIQFWADILLEHPDLLDLIPGDAIPVIWGYEASHPFEDQCSKIAATGLDFQVCSGTSSWTSFTGRLPNALDNLKASVRAAQTHGAQGILIAEWGDHGHLQPLSAAEAPLMLGAGLAWNSEATIDLDRAEALFDRHLYRSIRGSIGVVVRRLGEVYRWTGGRNFNGTELFRCLVLGRDPFEVEGLEPEKLNKARNFVVETSALLKASSTDRIDDELIRGELAWGIEISKIAIDLIVAQLDAGARNQSDLPEGIRRQFSERLSASRQERARLWLERNRSGGLAHALESLTPSFETTSIDQSG